MCNLELHMHLAIVVECLVLVRLWMLKHPTL